MVKDRESWHAAIHGVTKSWTRLRLNNNKKTLFSSVLILDLALYLRECLIIRASLTAQLVKNWPAMQETLVQFLGWEDLLEKGQATLSSIPRLPW